MYLLLSNEYIKGEHGIAYQYLNTETGDVLTYEDKSPIYPFFYTTLPIEEILNNQSLRDGGYVKKNGELNNSRIISLELETRIDVMTRTEREYTKIILSPSYIQNIKRKKFESLYKLLPSETIFGGNHKYIDQFTNERGHILGMSYTIGMSGIEVVLPEKLPHHKSFDIYPDEVVEWAKPRLFASIPKLSQFVLAMDIEVDIPQRRQPDPQKVEFPISSICFVSKEETMLFLLNDSVRKTKKQSYARYDWKKARIRKYNSERQMISDAIDYLIKDKRRFVAGHTIDHFDIPYLMNRAELFGLVYDEIYARYESVFNSVTKKSTTKIIKGIKGKWLIDLGLFMANPSIRNYAFSGAYDTNSLEDISQALLGYGKVQHELWFSDMSSAELGFYNIQDTQLIIDLLEYNNEIIFQLMIMLMRLGGLTIESVCRRMVSATLKGYFDFMFDEMNMMYPNFSQLMSRGKIMSASNTGKRFKGAFVFDPSPSGENTRGVHFNVWAVDFQSLYPSEIKERNICFSTANCIHEECKENKVPYLSHHMCGKITGFLPIVLGFIRDSRVYFFKPERKNNPEYGIIEQTLKVLINAGYGVVSSPNFEYYCPPVGESVTAWGRYDINRVFDKVEEDEEETLYADTDSAFIDETEREYIEELIIWTRENTGLELGVDYIADFMVLYRSKNYFMKIGDKFNIKGMLGIKKNTPPIIKEAFDNVLEVIKGMTKENYEETRSNIIRVIREYKNYILGGDIDDPSYFISPQTMTKEITKYKRPTTASRCALMMANKMNSELDRKVSVDKLVPEGSIVDVIYVDSLYRLDSGTPVRPLSLTENHMIDRRKYVERLQSVVSQVYIPFDITWEEIEGQQDLNEWF